jgi:HlyD family secretion protein
MNRRPIIALAVLALAGGGGFAWWYSHRGASTDEVVLYGNIDLRQVEVAFTDSGRIVDVLVDEGDRVTRGEVLARLDTGRLTPQIDQVKAQIAAQTAVVDKLRSGSRPEEIEQARASVDAAQADADNAAVSYERLQMLTSSGGNAIVTASQVDAAKAAFDAAQARLTVAQKGLELVVAGPRKQDVEQAEAQLQAIDAQLALLDRQLADAELLAPVDGVVRSRLMEPGEIASPQRPVFSLAIVDPKWVRAYVSGPDLPKVRPGMDAAVTVDGTGDTRFAGRIGFISPVAEFTPRSIQTEELRTSLVYEVRVLVTDPRDELRLGMPATVNLLPVQASATAATAEAQP